MGDEIRNNDTGRIIIYVRSNDGAGFNFGGCVMNITRTQSGDVLDIKIEGRDFTAHKKIMGERRSQLKIEGKSPSRRVIREIMKELAR